MKVDHVYIQQREGTYVAPCGFSCHEGFRFLGKNVHLFEEEQLPDLPLTPSTLVHGWVRAVHTALKQIGRPIPEPIDYPEELSRYLATPVRRTTLGEVHVAWNVAARTGGSPKPVFIKPVAHKFFVGHTIEAFSHLGETYALPMDTPIWAADVVNHVSEYRCFVHENSLVGFKHYRGDPWLLPDKRTIMQMIRDYAPSAPVAYGLDVGLVKDSDMEFVSQGYRTCLIEINDCYSLGNYCFNPITYCEMLEARWIQLMGV